MCVSRFFIFRESPSFLTRAKLATDLTASTRAKRAAGLTATEASSRRAVCLRSAHQKNRPQAGLTSEGYFLSIFLTFRNFSQPRGFDCRGREQGGPNGHRPARASCLGTPYCVHARKASGRSNRDRSKRQSCRVLAQRASGEPAAGQVGKWGTLPERFAGLFETFRSLVASVRAGKPAVAASMKVQTAIARRTRAK